MITINYENGKKKHVMGELVTLKMAYNIAILLRDHEPIGIP